MKFSVENIAKVIGLLFAIGVPVSASVAGCGSPTDPGAPEAPEAGTPEGTSACFGVADGTSCPGTNKLCIRGVCSDPICGDGIVTAPEECDRGVLNAPGSGCEPSCKFTCVSTDAARNCDTQSQDSCISGGTCDDQNHTCKAGGPKPTGSTCGAAKFCKGADCVEAVCGDAVVTSPEACDNGSANGPKSGCESNCSFSCANPATDCTALPCNTSSCTADHRCTTTPDATKNGQGCGAGLVCNNGACIAPGASCGNGILEGGEDCDLGTGFNGPGTGCETICKFSCTTSPNSCTDTNACHVAPTCAAVTVNGKAGQKCVTGAVKPDGDTCGVGSICIAGACKPSLCGDGFRDPTRSEDCDDGNLTKLDACSDTCKFEQDHRVIALKMQFGTDAYCTANAVGGAIGTLARSSFQSDIDAGIKDGSTSALFTFSGDLAGISGAVTVGNLSGAPPSNAPPYSGTSDLDWWYTPAAASIDATRTARATLTGTYAGSVLNATGRLNLLTSVGGQIASLAASGAKITMPIGASTTPATSTGAPPGHVASEHLSPTLQSFATGGNTVGSPTAQMCGNIAASSLENTAPPASLLPGGANACNENYSTANRLIDIIVHGCHVTQFNVVALKPTQPDQVDAAAPVAGAGGPYTLATDAATKRVTTCRDNNNAVVTLQTCLNAAAYSMSFKFATDRVIIK